MIFQFSFEIQLISLLYCCPVKINMSFNSHLRFNVDSNRTSFSIKVPFFQFSFEIQLMTYTMHTCLYKNYFQFSFEIQLVKKLQYQLSSLDFQFSFEIQQVDGRYDLHTHSLLSILIWDSTSLSSTLILVPASLSILIWDSTMAQVVRERRNICLLSILIWDSTAKEVIMKYDHKDITFNSHLRFNTIIVINENVTYIEPTFNSHLRFNLYLKFIKSRIEYFDFQFSFEIQRLWA